MSYESPDMRDERIDVAELLGAVSRRLPRIVLVTLALLAVTFFVLMFVPRLYESSASILVETRSNVYSRAANEQAPASTGNETGVVSSQIELIKSRDTLLKVIDELDLRSVPEFNGSSGGGFSPVGIIAQLLGRKSTPVSIDETVLGNLNERLAVSQERDSRLISVQVSSTDPQLAADIANAVAKAHVARRAQLSLSDTAEASGWLRAEIDRLRVVVKDAETAVANFKVDNDLFVGSNNTSLLDQQLSAIATQISSAQERKNTAVSRADLIRGMLERGQSIEGVADVRDSVVIQRLSEEKAGLQGEKAQRSATLLSSHPVIRALAAQINELDNQIALEGRRVADALDAEAQIEADLEASLKDDLVQAKVSASTATQDTVNLDGLQREAKAQRDLLEGYLQRYNEAFSRTETSSALPDVRVVSVAASSVKPASPKTTLILTAVGIVAFIVQIGVVVFAELMSGRAIVVGGADKRSQDELEEAPFSAAELEAGHLDLAAANADDDLGDGDYRYADIDSDSRDEVGPGRYDAGADGLGYDDRGEDVAFAQGDDAEIDDMKEPTFGTPNGQGSGVQTVIEPAPHNRFVRALAARFEAEPTPEASVVAERSSKPKSSGNAASNRAAERAARRQTAPASGQTQLDVISVADLTGDLVLGRTHLVMLAAHRAPAECEAVAEELVADALARGLSVALIDAGSARPSEEPGLSDLSSDKSSFGDVVHKSADNSFAEVPWGRGAAIVRQSTKPVTLVEALGDIYEVVILLTGRVGMNSTLTMFAGMKGRLVLVANVHDDSDAVADSRSQLVEAGFGTVEVAQGPARVAA